MLDQQPLLRRAAKWLLVALAFLAVAAAADLIGDALTAVAASIVFGV